MSLLVVTAADVVISKGYEGKPGVTYYDGDNPSMRFRIGAKYYDSRAENKARWVNVTVKAFGPLCERAKKMKLQEGSRITVVGKLDEDRWHDDKTGEGYSAPVIIAEIIEYCGSTDKKSGDANNGQNRQPETPQGQQPQANQPAQVQGQPAQGPLAQPDYEQQVSGGFTGYEQFGGQNPFFPSNA